MPILEIIFLISILKATEKCWTHYRYRCPLASNQTFPYCFLIQLTQANLPFLLICNWPGDQNERGESVHLPVRCLRIWWVTMSAIFKCLRLLIHKAAKAMLFSHRFCRGFLNQCCHKLDVGWDGIKIPSQTQGGRCWAWSWSSPKGRTPDKRYFVAKHIVLSRFTFWKAFVELSTKVILLWRVFNKSQLACLRAFREPAFGEKLPIFTQL